MPSTTWNILIGIIACLLLSAIVAIVCCVWRKRRNDAMSDEHNLKDVTANRPNTTHDQQMATTKTHDDDALPNAVAIAIDTQTSAEIENVTETNKNTNVNSDVQARVQARQQPQKDTSECVHSDSEDDNTDTDGAGDTVGDLISVPAADQQQKAAGAEQRTSFKITLNDDIVLTGGIAAPTTTANHEEQQHRQQEQEAMEEEEMKHAYSSTTVLYDDDDASVNAEQTPRNELPVSRPEPEQSGQTHIDQLSNFLAHPSRTSASVSVSASATGSVLIHPADDSFDADVDFADNMTLDGDDVSHGLAPSVQIHDDLSLVGDDDEDEDEDGDALIVGTLPSHYLSDSAESLDPDFVLEAAYFQGHSQLLGPSQNRDDSISMSASQALPGFRGGGGNNLLAVHGHNMSVTQSVASTVYSHGGSASLNSLSGDDDVGGGGGGVTQDIIPPPTGSDNEEQQSHAVFNVSKDMDFGGSTQWSMPGISMDHTASIQMLRSIQMFGAKAPPSPLLTRDSMAPAATNPVMMGQSIQYDAAPKTVSNSRSINMSAIGQSVQYERAPAHANTAAVSKLGVPGAANGNASMAQSIQLASSSMGGEQFVMWQMHGRKLKNMKHADLVDWLQKSGFDNDTIAHFRQFQIDGARLWSNIRNASMFFFNVGVVRPTLRDAILQQLYATLIKTPGFEERHMSDFKNLQLIADGPISTVYKAVIQKEKLKLRESIVVVKGYHFAADDVRVGKIIQILVHMVTHVSSSRFVKIYGFIRNMMETQQTGQHAQRQRPMFGIVMEYCDDASLHSLFKRAPQQYHDKYNVMDKLGIVKEVALAMSELHRKKMLHRNLKASNVLVSNGDDIKLTDYCLDVTQLTDFTHSADATERSIRWMSPELIQTQTYSAACDIYAFGITMYEILSGHKPYHEYATAQQLVARIIQENLRPNIDDLANLPEALLLLMTKCWSEHASQRPRDFEEILDELQDIQELLRKSCITFEDRDVYARARISYLQNGKNFQSSPLLNIDGTSYSDDDAYEDDEEDDDDDDVNEENMSEADDEKFQSLLQPYNDENRPTHVKDDSALDLDSRKKKIMQKRNKKKVTKKRPRKPLPKAPPVKKALPTMHNDDVRIEIQPNVTKQIHMPDKPLPQKPLDQ